MTRRTIYKAGPSAGATSAPLGPLAAALAAGSAAMTSGYGASSNAQFGPGNPPPDSPLGGDPRQSEYRPFWNMPSLPGEGRLVDYKTLRAVAKLDPFVRKAIEVRKDQITQLTFDLIARDRKDAKKARNTVAQQQESIEAVKQWALKPDGRHNWQQWLRLIMEDHLVLDGVALEIRRNLDPGAGRVSAGTGKAMGKMLWLEGVDATTIKVLRDTSGRLPLPPLKAYQQYLFGMPRASFSVEEMIYAVKNPTYDSVYGYSAVESFLTLINLNLRYWASQNAIYTDGTLPEGIVTAPEGWTAQQMKTFSDNWNTALAGDPKALRKLQIAPHGLGWIAFKEHMFDKELARFLLDILALAMDLTPNELGFEPSGNRGMGGKGYAESQERVQSRRAVGPTTRFLFDYILNPILWDEFGLTDLEWATVDKEDMDEESRAKADDIDIRNGRISIDELIERDGGEPIGVGRLFVVGQNLVLGEKDLQKLTQEGAAALGLLQPVELDENGMPVEPPPPAMIGPDGKPMTDPKTGEPLQHPTIGPDGNPVKLPMDPKLGDKLRDEQAKAGGKPPLPGKAPAPAPKADKAADPELLLDDLRRWETKATRALKRGRAPAVRFDSDYIPLDLANRISERLKAAESVEDVREAFVDDVLKEAIAERWSGVLLGELARQAA